MLNPIAMLVTGVLAAATPTPPERVALVSIDALHPAALTAKTMPIVSRWARLWKVTLDGRSTSPPKTLIAHTATQKEHGTDHPEDGRRPLVMRANGVPPA